MAYLEVLFIIKDNFGISGLFDVRGSLFSFRYHLHGDAQKAHHVSLLTDDGDAVNQRNRVVQVTEVHERASNLQKSTSHKLKTVLQPIEKKSHNKTYEISQV